jgi:hypothetical protein
MPEVCPISRSEAEVLAPALFQARHLSQMTGREWEQDALRFGHWTSVVAARAVASFSFSGA